MSIEDIKNKPAIGEEELGELTIILQEYKASKALTEQRLISSENWWKLHNSMEESRTTNIGADGGFTASSGWLHNVVVSKHADAMESYPEPNILPREEGDKQEAKLLSSIIPCVLEQNGFEDTYSTVMWQKLKYGTGVYKVTWDSSKLNSLGDISIEPVNLLNLYWEPGITDIQRSRYVFHTELVEKDVLEQQYPEQLKDKLNGSTFMSTRFLYDEKVRTENKVTVVEVYYHKPMNGKNTLQYIKYVNNIVIYATENEVGSGTYFKEPGMEDEIPIAVRGLYDHGLYPYVFDTMYPIEGSPCGYGYVDVCRNPQTMIDLLNTSIVKNSMVASTPRFFSRNDGGVNEEEFLDLSKPIVHTNNVTDDALRQITFSPISSVYLNALQMNIDELRQTSGNTETSTGNISSGVTAASAIAALQEASGKGSRDATKTSYRSYTKIIELCIELVRQFYDMPRQFRIVGQFGMEQYVTYTNSGIVPQYQGNDFGEDMGYRLPVFDIKVTAQKANVYTKVSQNELAMQFFNMGFFNPQMADQALMCLEIMDFDGKDGLMQKISQQQLLFQKLVQYMQMTLMLASESHPEMVQGISNDIMQTTGNAMPNGSAGVGMEQADNIQGLNKSNNALVNNARKNSANASQPDSGDVVKSRSKQ